MTDALLRIAAILLIVTGLGFGIPCLVGIRSLAAGNGVPLIMGFPAYGMGSFERYGVKSTVPLVSAFLLVCALEVLAGMLVWNARLSGAWLSLALLVPGAVFWWGFALPFPPLFALVRTVLILVRWSDLS